MKYIVSFVYSFQNQNNLRVGILNIFEISSSVLVDIYNCIQYFSKQKTHVKSLRWRLWKVKSPRLNVRRLRKRSGSKRPIGALNHLFETTWKLTAQTCSGIYTYVEFKSWTQMVLYFFGHVPVVTKSIFFISIYT